VGRVHPRVARAGWGSADRMTAGGPCVGSEDEDEADGGEGGWDGTGALWVLRRWLVFRASSARSGGVLPGRSSPDPCLPSPVHRMPATIYHHGHPAAARRSRCGGVRAVVCGRARASSPPTIKRCSTRHHPTVPHRARCPPPSMRRLRTSREADYQRPRAAEPLPPSSHTHPARPGADREILRAMHGPSRARCRRPETEEGVEMGP
jgi:hypothetical protein